MQSFIEFVVAQDLNVLLENDNFYNLVISLGKRNATREEIYNEFLSGAWNAAQNMGQNAMSGIQNAYQGIKSGVQQAGQAYQTGEKQNQIKQASQKVKDLQTDLSKIGMTDQKVQNFLTNVNHALQVGLGKSLSLGNKGYGQGGDAKGYDPNAALTAMRNMVRQNRATMQPGGSGI